MFSWLVYGTSYLCQGCLVRLGTEKWSGGRDLLDVIGRRSGRKLSCDINFSLLSDVLDPALDDGNNSHDSSEDVKLNVDQAQRERPVPQGDRISSVKLSQDFRSVGPFGSKEGCTSHQQHGD